MARLSHGPWLSRAGCQEPVAAIMWPEAAALPRQLLAAAAAGASAAAASRVGPVAGRAPARPG